jgi:hypothetical protein
MLGKRTAARTRCLILERSQNISILVRTSSARSRRSVLHGRSNHVSYKDHTPLGSSGHRSYHCLGTANCPTRTSSTVTRSILLQALPSHQRQRQLCQHRYSFKHLLQQALPHRLLPPSTHRHHPLVFLLRQTALWLLPTLLFPLLRQAMPSTSKAAAVAAQMASTPQSMLAPADRPYSQQAET